MARSKNQIMLSFDLELWHEGVSLRRYLPENKENLQDCLEESVAPILDLLAKHRARATFFVTGKVIEKYPELVKEIANLGHEIGSHGFSHRLLNELTPHQFEEEIKKSVELLKGISGISPIGFRAPNLSLTKDTSWALPILAKHGFKYDSSIFPFNNYFRINSDFTLIEVSPTCYSLFGIKIPVAGSVYFRFWPLYLFKKMVAAIQKENNPVLYFHPWELYGGTPVVKNLPWLKKIARYYGTKKSLAKFEELLKTFQFDFDSMENVLKEQNLIPND